jgi:hypothetical protein
MLRPNGTNGTIGPPVVGEWLVLNPPGHAPYAFDLIAVDAATGRYASRGGLSFVAGMIHVEDVHGWGRPVLAPLDGEVIVAHDGERDRRRLMPLMDVPAGFLLRPLLYRKRIAAMAGNHVVVSTSSGHLLLAHLQQHSVTVRSGQRVEAGHRLGRVGHTGNSIGPHLHLQMMDGPDPLTADVVPFRVARCDAWTGSGWKERIDAHLPTRPTRVRFAG